MEGKHYFYILLSVTVVLICFTNPFMRFPYDVWEHLFTMDSEYINHIHMPEGRKIWHYLWSDFFHLIDIDNSQLFLRAKIIHITQILISFFSIFLFSKVVIRILYRTIDPLMLRYMAYWSVVIWFTIFATFSVYYHQAWILWYSVNYQITLPLFWYSMALTLIVFFEDKPFKLKLFYLLQIIIVLLFILLVHPMEFLYFMLYASILLLLYADKMLSIIRRYYMLLIPFSVALFYIAKQIYSDHLPYIVTDFQISNLSKLYEKIISNGEILVDGGSNRAFASFNELMIVILVLGIGMSIVLLYNYKKHHKAELDRRIFFFLLMGSLFVLVPIFPLSAGFASVMTKVSAVNRFYYSSALFVLLPVVIYYILLLLRKNKRIYLYNFTIIIVLALVTLYSRDISHTKNYYKNIKSLEYSFHEDMVGCHLSPKNIKIIGQRLQEYEKHRDHSKKVLYLARGDIAMVLRYIYRKNVYWRGRKTNPTYQNILDYKRIKRSDPSVNRQEFIIFETPKEFPVYEPFK